MKAVVCERWGPFDELEIKDVKDVSVTSDHDVLIKVVYEGVSWATNLMVEGKYQRKPELPFVPGTEIAGIVIDVGQSVTNVSVGDRVCAVLDLGGYAEQAVVHERHVFALPDSMSLAEAVTLPISYMTAYGGLLWRGKLKPGEKVLVHGAAGGVGLAAADIAASMGCDVYPVVRGDDKVAFMKARGFQNVIDSSKESFRAVVNDMTAGEGVNLVLDPIGGSVLDDSLRCLADDGRHIVIGFVQGEISRIPANILLLKNISVGGFALSQYIGWGIKDERERYEAQVREGMEALIRWVESGKIRPEICQTYPFNEYREAMQMVQNRRSIGRVLLSVGRED